MLEGAGEIIVSGLPRNKRPSDASICHRAVRRAFVDLGSATNACQRQNRIVHSEGLQPCVEEESRAGIWRYDANKTGEVFPSEERYASGIRNGEGLAVDKQGQLFSTQHGRDQLRQNWPDLYSNEQGSDSRAKDVIPLKRGDDYRWPECCYNAVAKRLVLEPEYGGDGGKKLCSTMGRTGSTSVTSHACRRTGGRT